MAKPKISNPKTDGEENEFGDYEAYEDEMGRRHIEIGDHKYLIVADGHYALYTIKLQNGGPVPHALAGMYTSVHEATKAIQVHLGQTEVN